MKKLRIWDSKALADTLTTITQMHVYIDALGAKLNAQSLSGLPPSLVPTNTLYEICIGYELMYDKLLDYDLLNTGNKQTQFKEAH